MRKLINAVVNTDMQARHYTALVLFLVFILGVGFAGLNYVANDFGLWRHRDTARIWALEKTTKYLLAHRYVGENFDAVMIGSSVSANMDTRKIEKYKVYNLSMSGGNITETGAAAQAWLEAPGDHKLMIISLYPYLTKNSGMKGFQINPKEYYGSLFSLLPVRVWVGRVMDIFGVNTHAFDESEAGWNNFNFPWTRTDVPALVKQEEEQLKAIRAGKDIQISGLEVDPQAVRELDDLLQNARSKNVRIAAYYYPVFGPSFNVQKATGAWGSYRAAMDPLFRPGEIILDMNTRPFDGLRFDNAAYHDGAHLSQEGAGKVLDALNQALAK